VSSQWLFPLRQRNKYLWLPIESKRITSKLTVILSHSTSAATRAVSQLLWSQKVREEWFSLEENHDKAYRSGLHQLRNSSKQIKSNRFCQNVLADAKVS
jgi:hypothetical protein